MKSMTGFGRQDYRDEQVEISVEIKTVNHRYKDFFLKVPRTLAANEEKIRRTISGYLSRGHFEVYIQFKSIGMANKMLSFNHELAAEYIDILKEIRKMDEDFGSRLNVDLVARFPDMITVEEERPDDEVNWAVLEPVLKGALEQVVVSREREGAAMKADMLARCETLEKYRTEIAALAPVMFEKGQAALRERVRTYLQDAAIDESRILTEVAVMADKLAIDEELTRLQTHIVHLRELLQVEDVPVGRKLDFLIQELNREINTIGSKSNHIGITNLVVDVKSEIEKIREQVQNIE